MINRICLAGFSLLLSLAAIPLAAADSAAAEAADSARKAGTTLSIRNATNAAVPVQITLGSAANPAQGYGISNIRQLPTAWAIVPEQSAPTTQGIFILAAKQSVSFNSGTRSFSGNVAFGPKFSGRGCGDSSAGACYPNSINLGEFTLNISGGAETVDISNVNGANAYLTINFHGQTAANLWNDGSFTGANANVRRIANLPLNKAVTQSGVYGWQATNCTNVVPPLPNPTASCPAPINGPATAQLQDQARCNIQRGSGVPSGGIVEIVFGGYLPNSAPGLSCVSTRKISPAGAIQTGGTSVSISGWGLAAVTGVSLQGAAASQIVATNQLLTFTTPACNFCTASAPQPWNSNVILTLSNGSTYTVPASVAGANAVAAFTYTSEL